MTETRLPTESPMFFDCHFSSSVEETPFKVRWTVRNFSKIPDCIFTSPAFEPTPGCKWKLELTKQAKIWVSGKLVADPPVLSDKFTDFSLRVKEYSVELFQGDGMRLAAPTTGHHFKNDGPLFVFLLGASSFANDTLIVDCDFVVDSLVTNRV